MRIDRLPEQVGEAGWFYREGGDFALRLSLCKHLIEPGVRKAGTR